MKTRIISLVSILAAVAIGYSIVAYPPLLIGYLLIAFVLVCIGARSRLPFQ